ncbi:transcriptional regulator, TetR family [Amycolatopsis marina]|uniref:Transcriptional regulator, TetR family n=1 Tax=Amycolatopsis marina TaxID=490629 RepID=A0A1I1AYM6_9PSEU|nr:TetR/AcrR family transcriptional regulator [Amycolatopsis marina]SFB41363.1 transcriptional regulator, TetR family [Amycolatopsis marina]
MVRLSRAETQERNRTKVLSAARDEFAERGFREAKIDVIAERAELTRGAVYSNFPGKRALYFAVLADLAEQWTAPVRAEPGRTARAALGALSRTWMARLSLDDLDERHGAGRLGSELMSEILADERFRRSFTQLMKLDALLLALALEQLRPSETSPDGPPARLGRLAETVLTNLHGASQLAAAAPGFIEPFDVVGACEQLAGLALNDWWAPPPVVPQTVVLDRHWSPPPALDVVRREPAHLTGGGVVTVLGLNRLAAAEQAIRAAPRGSAVTVGLVTSDRDELAPLARLVIADLASCLRQAFPRSAWPRLQIVCDEKGVLAAAAGVGAISDETEVAVRIEGGRLVAAAEGPGAGHAVAASTVDSRPSVTSH